MRTKVWFRNVKRLFQRYRLKMGIILKLTLRNMVWDVSWIHVDELW